MKTILLIMLLATFRTASAQFSFGPKINIGTGRINSQNMKENINARKASDPDIQTWEVKSKYGFSYSIGSFVQYNFTSNFSLLAEPTYGRLKHKIDINYQDNKLDNNGDGNVTSITSVSAIKLSYYRLPLLVKYSFSDEKRFYGVAGFGLFFTGSTILQSAETETKVSYKKNVIDKTDISYNEITATLDAFKSPRTCIILGAGTALELAGKILSIDIRYDLPFTKSEMYTTNAIYHAYTFKNDEYFDLWGKAEAEAEVPQYRLNDFKMGIIEISIAYALFKK